MSTCPNCGKKLGCGCERRLAINGKRCCKHCVNIENAKTQIQKIQTPSHNALPNSPPK